MEKHFELSDSEFKQQFINCELNPEIFTHEAHLRLAWIYIKKYGIEQAETNIPRQLREYVKSVGAENKYNTTLTLAAIKAVYHFILKSDANSFREFIIEFPRLKNNFRELMACHYGVDIYNSQKAKMKFLEPDLLPFD
ncbi:MULTISPECIES: hypothetical protein [Mesonia]|uniref:Uncharacterized protein n=1 Tax=Mesonia oceanica TaxID=2687242 RepID=A0AC61YE68_9FLAO|nr:MULTISPECIES: hypothetical protein [Mesonia]MAN27680.1 hypothetical protein [Mesonia sp.]MAQ40730.1 hypothetical protein [Mesonia sp.]MBJ98846.1 hypothetical protein [Flavobacteriaceae bacterium]VVV02540.1 hypothetical protein FVB9532_03840 [Mesonia oceanica]|tara:strand:+ start:3184 stop:3597 length:414 start_codon:yes stop_codon:yes gene_type:complete